MTTDEIPVHDYAGQMVGEKLDITGDGGLIKEIIKVGLGADFPEKSDKVSVHYVGTLESDGSEFDSSRGRNEPFTFTLGEGKVIKGWDIGVATMRKGEIARFTIKSDLAYGASGSPPKIPGGATLIFEVELLDWVSSKDITGDGGIIKKMIKEGEGWDQPRDDDEVTLHLTATLAPSSPSPTPTPAAAAAAAAPPVFFSTPEEGAEFIVREGFFCKAVPIAVKKMKKGEQAKFTVRPDYGFGEQGHGVVGDNEVPAGASIEITMTLVGWKKVDKVTPDGGVVKKVLIETQEWQRPNIGATVTVTYTAKIAETGVVFEERTEESPLVFVTDEEQAPHEGLELAIMQMKKGEKALVTISPNYAYGADGAPQKDTWTSSVPPNATLVYEITLVDFVKGKDTWDMSTEEKVEAANLCKEKGNAAFKAGNLDRATTLWERAKQAIEYDDTFEPQNKKASRDIKKSCDLNLAAAHLKSKNYLEARKAAEKVLETDSFNMKALYRRAQSFIGTSDWVEAAECIKKGLGVEPENIDFKLLAKKLRAEEVKASRGEAKLWAGSFAKMAAAN